MPQIPSLSFWRTQRPMTTSPKTSSKVATPSITVLYPALSLEWRWLKGCSHSVAALESHWSPVLVPTLTTVGIFQLPAHPSQSVYADVLSHRHKHIPVSQRRFGISCSNRCDSCKTTFNFLFHHEAKHLSPFTILYVWQGMAQAWLFGCFVYFFTRPQEQERKTLTFISFSYLITAFYRGAKQHMYIYFDWITVSCERACRRLQPMLIAWQQACNNYVAC